MKTLDFLFAQVGHRRLTPRKNEFLYNVLYVVTPVVKEEITAPRLFSVNRFNAVSIYTKDHGAHDGSSWRDWIKEQCRDRGVSISNDDEVVLIAHPRIFGYVFNPISFWLVFEKDTHLKAVLCEVRNTFGDNHNYLLTHDDSRAILPTDVFTATKGLYVSPFNNVEKGWYRFSFDVTPKSFSTSINYFERDTHILEVHMAGSRHPLSTLRLVQALIRYPLMTFAIVYRIHVQAVRLYIKGVHNTLSRRPKPTAGKTTIGTAEKNN